MTIIMRKTFSRFSHASTSSAWKDCKSTWHFRSINLARGSLWNALNNNAARSLMINYWRLFLVMSYTKSSFSSSEIMRWCLTSCRSSAPIQAVKTSSWPQQKRPRKWRAKSVSEMSASAATCLGTKEKLVIRSATKCLRDGLAKRIPIFALSVESPSRRISAAGICIALCATIIGAGLAEINAR